MAILRPYEIVDGHVFLLSNIQCDTQGEEIVDGASAKYG